MTKVILSVPVPLDGYACNNPDGNIGFDGSKRSPAEAKELSDQQAGAGGYHG